MEHSHSRPAERPQDFHLGSARYLDIVLAIKKCNPETDQGSDAFEKWKGNDSKPRAILHLRYTWGFNSRGQARGTKTGRLRPRLCCVHYPILVLMIYGSIEYDALVGTTMRYAAIAITRDISARHLCNWPLITDERYISRRANCSLLG